ncbi:hypothetical protein [Clostridium estertheticum]|uniref:hypothetical protein n=1 Tax=Clostridium estertheticum TaxID=238834 RepID=UPI001C0B65A9|nr:hypothetical protein [Clostridium estertheticum]MBU3173705.1 hypothetical protein [Clostridium estertheticum]
MLIIGSIGDLSKIKSTYKQHHYVAVSEDIPKEYRNVIGKRVHSVYEGKTTKPVCI